MSERGDHAPADGGEPGGRRRPDDGSAPRDGARSGEPKPRLRASDILGDLEARRAARTEGDKERLLRPSPTDHDGSRRLGRRRPRGATDDQGAGDAAALGRETSRGGSRRSIRSDPKAAGGGGAEWLAADEQAEGDAPEVRGRPTDADRGRRRGRSPRGSRAVPRGQEESAPSSGSAVTLIVGGFAVGVGVLLGIPVDGEAAEQWTSGFVLALDVIHWFFLAAGGVLVLGTLLKVALGK